MGLKTPWLHMRDRFKDTFGIGSRINLESKWVLRHLGFICRIDSKTLLELEAELIWNQNWFKDTLVSNAG